MRGMIQGCGMRPSLARMAAERYWSGSVRNTPDGVELLLQGNLPSDDQLRAAIIQSLPRAALLNECQISTLSEHVSDGFQIVSSVASGPLTASLPPDRAICRDCLLDMRDSGNRRFGYPFTSCAECGPRYSILHSMPFDRHRTAMGVFEMCLECRREYFDPQDRRFHAQTISCTECGPRVWISNATDDVVSTGNDDLETAANHLCAGAILAVRGIGGYQLLVDATSDQAIRELRRRKRRTVKPLAVLCRTIADCRRLAWMSSIEEEQLESSANPIVLLRQKHSTVVSPLLNPNLVDIGLMLPSSGLHDRLLQLADRPLVCTSGNRDGDPLAYRTSDAETQLADIADVIVHHNLEIHRPIDDSVVRVMANRSVTIRAGRGIAPMPINLPVNMISDSGPKRLAVGGHQKAAFALSTGSQAILGPHIGDLDTVRARDRWCEQLQQLSSLTQISSVESDAASADVHAAHESPVVCDAHPEYFSTQWAAAGNRPVSQIWHHHAHVLASIQELGWLDREVLGVAWDGTGLGPDGTIWGGEFLVANRRHFVRVAHLRPFALPGGDSATTDLRRLAVATLLQVLEWTPAELANEIGMAESDVCRLIKVIRSPQTPTTSSMGRLFDAVACLVLGQRIAAYEGHAAMCLEAACDSSALGSYHLPIFEASPVQLDWRPLIGEIVADRATGVSAGVMAMRLHRALAEAIIEVASCYPALPVVLGGGVFQNRVLVELVAASWPANGPELGLPGSIPPNDGGLAVGQLVAEIPSLICPEDCHVPGNSRSSRPLD